MPAFTPNLNLYKPGGGSTGTILPDEVVDIDRINSNMDTLDQAIGDPSEQNRQWYGPATQINTLPVSPKEGDFYQESDGNRILWRRVGGVWVTNEGGLFLIRPASVVNGTVNAAGEIVPTAAAACSINGVFSSRFREYIVKFAVKGSANAALAAVFRNAGADFSSISWATQGYNSNSGTINAASGAVTNIPLSAAATASFFTGSLELSNPAHAAKKTYRLQSGSDALLNRTATAYAQAVDGSTFDGLTISLTVGAFDTGHSNYFKIYGLA